MKWSEEQIKEYLGGLEPGAEIDLKDLILMVDWHPADLRKFLADYTERPLFVARRATNHPDDVVDRALFGAAKTRPVFMVGEKIPDALPSPIIVRPGYETISVPVGVPLTEIELEQIADKETLDWWKNLGYFRRGELSTGFDTYTFVPMEEHRVRHKTYELPEQTWNLSKIGKAKKPGLYKFLMDEFGWSMGQAVAYFDTYLRDESVRIGPGRYRLSSKTIKIPVAGQYYEDRPTPIRVKSVLRWQSARGGSRTLKDGTQVDRTKKPTDYDDHMWEFHGYIRVPSGMPPDEVEQVCADLMQLILDANKYPTLNEILKGWHNAELENPVFMGTTTTTGYQDGTWKKLYNGTSCGSGTVSVARIYVERRMVVR